MEAIEQLQEFLSTSIEFLDTVDSLKLSREEAHVVKTTPTSPASSERSSFVRCPNKPQEHARILKSRLKRHLENCKAYTSARENLNQSYPPPPPVGGPPSSRLIHPPPKSENFYHRAPEAITIVYKAHEEKFDRSIAHEDDPDPTLLKEGLYRLDHPGLNEVFVYDPPAGCTNQSDPSSSNSRQTNAAELYDKHCHLIQVIKNATGASDASDAPHSNEVVMTDLSLLIPKTADITTEMVRERIQQIQKRKAEERREDILLEQLKLERERRRRRQNDLPIDERLEAPQAKALIENAGIFEADKEFIRKLLLAGRGGPWRAAIEIFGKDVKQAQEAIAELELEKEVERKRKGDAGERGNNLSSERSPSPYHNRRSRSIERNTYQDKTRRDWSRERRYRSPESGFYSRERRHSEYSSLSDHDRSHRREDYGEDDHRGDYYRREDHRRDDYRRDDYRRDDYRRDDYRRDDYRRDDYRRDDYRRDDYKRDDYRRDDYRQDDRREDYRQEDYMREDHRRGDYRWDDRRDDYRREDYRREDHRREDHRREDYKYVSDHDRRR